MLYPIINFQVVVTKTVFVHEPIYELLGTGARRAKIIGTVTYLSIFHLWNYQFKDF